MFYNEVNIIDGKKTHTDELKLVNFSYRSIRFFMWYLLSRIMLLARGLAKVLTRFKYNAITSSDWLILCVELWTNVSSSLTRKDSVYIV